MGPAESFPSSPPPPSLLLGAVRDYDADGTELGPHRGCVEVSWSPSGVTTALVVIDYMLFPSE